MYNGNHTLGRISEFSFLFGYAYYHFSDLLLSLCRTKLRISKYLQNKNGDGINRITRSSTYRINTKVRLDF